MRLLNGSTFAILDTLTFHTFHSAVVVLGGEFQTPTPLPPENNHGIFKAAIELYANQGYDVRMYDEDDVDSEGNGPVFDELRNSINKQGYTEVALIGYSHGGGSVYDLSVKLEEESNPVFGSIMEPYTITMTAYVDAIETGTILAETRRPKETEYHYNQWQQNSAVFNGDHTQDSEELDDLVNYTGVEHITHGTIDDELGVLFSLELKVRQKVTR